MHKTRRNSSLAFILLSFLTILVLTACKPQAASPQSLTESTDVVETTTASTEVPTPEPTSTFSLPVAIGTPYPQTEGTFGLDEVEPVVQLARWGDGNLNDVLLSPDGQTLVAGFTTGLKLFDVATLQEISSPFTDAVEILEIQFSADGSSLALMTDHQVLVYDWKSKELKAKLDSKYDQGMNYWPILANLSFSPDGKTLAAVVDNQLRLVDTASGVENLAAKELRASAAFFSADGQSLVVIESGETSHMIVFMDAHSLEEEKRLDLQDYSSNTFLSADHRTLAVSLSRTNEVVIVDLENQVITSTINQSTYYDSDIYSYTTEELTFSPDSKWLVGRFGGSDRLMVWDVAAGRSIDNGILFTGYGSKFTFSPDGSRLFGFFNESGKDGYSVWSTANWEWEFSEAEVPAGEVFFPSNEAYLLVEDNKTISNYWADYPIQQNMNDLSFVQFAVKKYESSLPTLGLEVSIRQITYLDESMLATITDQGVQIRDADTYEVVNEVRGDFSKVEISGDKRTLAAVLSDGSIQLYALPELTPASLLRGQEGSIARVFLEPQGKTLISTSEVETVVWDCASGERALTLENGSQIMHYLFLPGEFVGVARDFSLITWDPSTGDQVHTYMGSSVAAEGLLAVNQGGVNTYGVAKEGFYRLEWSAYPSTYPMIEHAFGQVLQIALSDNEERLAVLIPEGIKIFNLVNNELVKSIEGSFASITFIPGSEDLLAAADDQLVKYSDDLPAVARSAKFFYSEGLRNPQFIGANSPYAPSGVQGAKDVIMMVSPGVNADFYYDPVSGHLDWAGLHDLYLGYGVDQFSPIVTAWSPDGANQASLVMNQPYEIFLEVNPHAEGPEDESLPPTQRTLTPCVEINDLHIKVSNNGRVVVECGNYRDGYSLYVYDGDPPQLVETIRVGDQVSDSVALSPDGNRLVFIQKVEDAYRYDLTMIDLSVAGQSKVLIQRDQGDVTRGNFSIESLAFDQSGELLAVGGTNGSIMVVDSKTLERLTTIEGHSRSVDGLLFFNENKLLLSTSADGTIRIWGLGDLVQ